MRMRNRGLLVAALQCAIVCSLAGKYAVDRERLPRVWVRTGPVDPTLPVRGRYISLRLELDGPDSGTTIESARLLIRNGRLTALPDRSGSGVRVVRFGGSGWQLADPVAFFLPEHAPDPSRRQPGEEVWVEVSVPRRGIPRPLHLGVRKDGMLTPLHFH
jgi:hypothetical protein